VSFCARVICYADILCSAAEVSASSPSFGDVHSIVMLADSLTENLPEVAGHPATMSTFDDHFQQPPDTFAPWPPEFLTQLALMHTDNLFFYPYNSALQPAFTGTDCEAPMDAGWHVDLLGKFTSSGRSPASNHGDYGMADKQRCTHPTCDKEVKDLKCHMLTHQNVRPEKCPIQSCKYLFKGFARKFDKHRHALTHYKGIMVCGFCPASQSLVEKSFNTAYLFKKHLTAAHGVVQTRPHRRKKTPTSVRAGEKLKYYSAHVLGTCSICSRTFANVQYFSEHLDGCILRALLQQESSAHHQYLVLG